MATSAIIKPTLVLGYTSLRVRFPATAAAGKPAGMYLKPNVLISAALLGGATIKTFNEGGTKALETYTLSNSLLDLSIQSSGVTQLSFIPKQSFKEIELMFFSLVAVGQDIAVYEAYSTTAPLPVVLTAFQGKATSTGVALSWQTASEQNSDYFVVERTQDPAAGFQPVGRVASAGTSSQTQGYHFVDASPVALGYYRLRQVDRDGSTSYSSVVAVAAQPPGASLAAYPSPAGATLTITGAAGAQLAIIDQMGRTLQRITSPASLVQQLDVQQLPAGSYYVRDETTGRSTKFMKIASL